MLFNPGGEVDINYLINPKQFNKGYRNYPVSFIFSIQWSFNI